MFQGAWRDFKPEATSGPLEVIIVIYIADLVKVIFTVGM